jgi:DNA polymerase (family 10)
LEDLKKTFLGATIDFTGEYRRRNPILEKIEFIVATTENIATFFDEENYFFQKNQDTIFTGKSKDGLPFLIYQVEKKEFGSKQFRYTSSRGFIERFLQKAAATDFKGLESEKEVFTKANLPYVEPELREDVYENIENLANKNLLQLADIKGVIHTHTTYSDGIHTLTEMADFTKKAGYEYLVISDHSQAAFYAQGLKPDRVLQQMAEIDAYNATQKDFKVFKSIECDILYDGRLDYSEEILAKFDMVIASVHSQLKMDETKANERLIKAIENPYTTMLGHPTGRLLLSREGYPIDHKKIIDACAANKVIVELNANPYRLDLDWTWIPYAMEKGVMISINPDAHSREGIHHIRYGVFAARKGGLTKEMCFNTKGLAEFEVFLNI